ncbi:MAG: glutathione-dependent reductase [Zetaproteobacteria bacterium]|nr:glutathione-dependent reductase [Pseudobdellovibrionaceae bacterium]
MGRLVSGKWLTASVITSGKDGGYERIPRSFLDGISSDSEKFQPESGRYHLYVSYACPWAHRTLIYRKLKNLEDHISVSVVHPDMLENGWSFATDFAASTGDDLYNRSYLYEIYQKADSEVSTSVTVPVLWDKKLQTIVNNESSEIIRIFNTAFNEITGNLDDYYPASLQKSIDAINDKVYENVNNGVYRSGFAKTQQAYDQSVTKLFETLDELEGILADRPYLVGDTLTEADIRLVPTLIRFDIVYVTHFKCNQRRIADYPNLTNYLNRLFKMDAIQSTTDFDHIKRHYYYSHESINPFRIIPIGPSHYIS